LAFVYNNGARVLNSSYWTTTTHKALLVPDTYTPNRDDVFVSAVGASECSGSGYSRGFNSPGRVTLSSKTVLVDNTINTVKYGAANASFVSLSVGTVGAVIVIQEVSTDANSFLIAYIDAATPQLTNGSQMPANFPTGYCFNITT
jgi:hypothetical protein